MLISTRAALAASAAFIAAVHAVPAAAQARYDFNLPRQPLAESLTTVASLSGANIAFRPDAVAGRAAPDLAGSYTVTEALGRLLVRSGLAATMTPGGSFLIQPEVAAVIPARSVRVAATPAAAVARPATPVLEAAVEEVVVTAQRREGRLQDVPIAVTALSSQAIATAGVSNAQQLTKVTPGLTFTHAGLAFQPTLRGVGTRAVGVGDEANVALYIDGVYQSGMTSAAADLLEVERIEVLRGPQGTLFGRNSTGGLINIITRDPAFETHGHVAAGYGRFNQRFLTGYVTGPLSDVLAADVAFKIGKDDGYIDNLVKGGKVPGEDVKSVRAKLLYAPSDRSRIRLNVSYLDYSDPSPSAYQGFMGNTPALGVTPRPVSATGPYQTTVNFGPIAERKDFAASLQTAFKFDGVNLETTSSYAWTRGYNLADSDSSPLPIATNDQHPVSDTVTQELRLLSDSDGRLTWIAGLFGFYNKAVYDHNKTTAAAGAPVNDFLVSSKTYAGAIFGEGSYHFTDALTLTAGLRYTYEWRRYDFVQNNVPIIVDDTVEGGELTPRVSLQYRFSPQAMAYATYSRGYKSAVFNGTSTPQVDPVRPETLNDYEIGVKLDPTRQVRLNLAAFYYDYNDIQFSARNAANGSILANAAQSTIKGAEAEAVWAPVRGFQLNATAAYLDATYDRFVNAVFYTPRPTGGNVLTTRTLEGTRMIRSPKFTWTIAPRYQVETDQGAFTVAANLYHSSRYYWDAQNRLFQPAYTELSGSIGWASPNDRFRVDVWGRNLTGAKVFQHMLPGSLSDSVVYERPASYGVTARVNF